MAKGAHGSSRSNSNNNNTTPTATNRNTTAPNDLSETLSDGEGGTFPCQIPPTTDFEYYGRPYSEWRDVIVFGTLRAQ